MTRWLQLHPARILSVGRVLRPRGVRVAESKPADCPHSWADHCPGKRRCKWRVCVVKGCGHVENRDDPDRCFDLPTPEAKGDKP